MFLASLFISLISSAERVQSFDWSCETALAPVPAHARQVFAGFLRLPSGSELFTRIERPRGLGPVRWVLLAHGLADSHRAYDGVAADLSARGFGVVRFDWRGFARSLHDRHPIPDVIDYSENVRDLREMILLLRRRFGIERPRLVGHSMGGGLVLALLAQPDVEPLVDQRHVVINPYVYRAEYYLLEKFSLAVHGWTPPLFQVLPQPMIDAMLDPILRPAFARHLREQSIARGTELSPERLRRVIDRQVDVTIGVTRGLRGLDGLEEIKNIHPGLRVDEVYGLSDGVVEPRLARRLGKDVEKRGGRLIPVTGDHWLPAKRPDVVARLIADPDAEAN